MEYLLDVVERASLEETQQMLHPMPWMTVSPAGEIQYFETEDEACNAQVAAGLAG